MSKKGIVDIHGKQYKTVVLRVNEFRAECPITDGWGISTSIVELSDKWACVRASITNKDGLEVGSGHGVEFWDGNNKINKTSALENAETSAVGRALASIGLGGEEYASADEVINAIKTQKEMEKAEVVEKPPVEITTKDHADAMDLVLENFAIMKTRAGEEEAIEWHKRVMSNFFGGRRRDDLTHEELADLADKQNQKIKTYGGD